MVAAQNNKDGASGRLNRDVQTQLGNQLRQMYNEVVGQGVPDKFKDLLAKLDQPGNGESKDSPK